MPINNVGVGQDFQNFLDQQVNQDPNNPNGNGGEAPNPMGVNIPPPPTPGGSVGEAPDTDPTRNSTTPREGQGNNGPATPGNPDNPGILTPPSPEATLPKQTPPRPTSPTPVAGGPAVPTQPLKGPSPEDLTRNPQQFDMLGKGTLMGSAGGLLGGGLGAPGSLTDASDNNSNILPLLLQLLQQKG